MRAGLCQECSQHAQQVLAMVKLLIVCLETRFDVERSADGVIVMLDLAVLPINLSQNSTSD